jgi:hypothetical protein
MTTHELAYKSKMILVDYGKEVEQELPFWKK